MHSNNNHYTRDVLRAKCTRPYVGHGEPKGKGEKLKSPRRGMEITSPIASGYTASGIPGAGTGDKT